MEQFFPFFLIVFSGVFFSMLSIRTHIPWAVMLILGGILFGPSAFNLIPINSTIDFIGEIGLIFLMFMAGLETRFTHFAEVKKSFYLLPLVNGLIPFLSGVLSVLLLGYSLNAALVVGIIFISSSIAVVIPTLEVRGLLNLKIGQSILMATMIQDIASLILLSIFLQNVSPVTEVPLHIFYPVLFGILLTLRHFIPKLREWVIKIATGSPDLFQLEFRSTFLILIGTVIAFELLGLHPIVAGFFSGLVLSDSIKSKVLKEKIKTISYGIFIPTFFIAIGLETNLSESVNAENSLLVTLVIIITLIISKFTSGYMGSRLVGFDVMESSFFASTCIPQLSTTLATAFVAFNLGIIDQTLLTSLVLLSIVTVLLSPMLMNSFSKAIARE